MSNAHKCESCYQVRDLARLSLREPEYLAVHAEAGAPTPAKLQQAVMEVPLHQKLDALWSFIKTHLRVSILLPVSGAFVMPEALLLMYHCQCFSLTVVATVSSAQHMVSLPVLAAAGLFQILF